MGMNRFEAIAKLIKEYNCKKVVELGVHEGLILENVLLDSEAEKMIETYYLVDFWRPHPPEGPQTEEQWDQWAQLVYSKFFWNDKVRIMRLNSVKAAAVFQPESMDMVYIDACHREYCVREDIKTWLPIVKKGGILSGHDWHLPRVRNPVHEKFGEEKTNILEPCRGEVGSWYIVKE